MTLVQELGIWVCVVYFLVMETETCLITLPRTMSGLTNESRASLRFKYKMWKQRTGNIFRSYPCPWITLYLFIKIAEDLRGSGSLLYDVPLPSMRRLSIYCARLSAWVNICDSHLHREILCV